MWNEQKALRARVMSGRLECHNYDHINNTVVKKAVAMQIRTAVNSSLSKEFCAEFFAFSLVQSLLLEDMRGRHHNVLQSTAGIERFFNAKHSTRRHFPEARSSA